jgi:hypothetical protein
MRSHRGGAIQFEAMQPEHDLYCDEQHLPRQQCNDALAPADVRASLATDGDVVEPPPATAEATEPEAPASNAIRDAVATADTPQPTVYVSREWERTAAAVSTAGDEDGFEVDEPSGGSGLRRAAMVVAAIAVVLLTVRGVRGRRGERV